MRKTKRVLFGELVMMDQTPLRQPFPTAQVERIDPFLLLHHHTAVIPSGSRESEVGIGPHPHRGFSPVTFVYKGSVHHRDSRGHSEVVSAGGVQWLDAGMGIIHSERPPYELARDGGETEIIQLWVNTPHARKMEQPAYQPFGESQLTDLATDSGKGRLKLVTGSLEGQRGPVNAKVPVIAVMGALETGATKHFDVPEGMQPFVYLLDGRLNIGGHGLVDRYELVLFEQEGGAIEIEAMADTRFLLMAGMPINEKVEQQGPFVMSNQTEIMEAMRDYQMGKMGYLVEEFAPLESQ